MKVEIAQDQQTTCNGIEVFQKCRQLFNKQGIGKFIFSTRWKSVETEKVARPFFPTIVLLETIQKNYVQNRMRI